MVMGKYARLIPNTRTIMWYLIFIGSMLQYMIRITINITITEMVLKYRGNSTNKVTAECFILVETSKIFPNSTIDNSNNSCLTKVHLTLE